MFVEDEPPFNPTTLAKEFGIRNHKPGEGDGRLITWEDFWNMLERTYWRRRVERTGNATRNELSSQRVS